MTKDERELLSQLRLCRADYLDALGRHDEARELRLLEREEAVDELVNAVIATAHESVNVNSGASIKDAIARADAPYNFSCSICGVFSGERDAPREHAKMHAAAFGRS